MTNLPVTYCSPLPRRHAGELQRGPHHPPLAARITFLLPVDLRGHAGGRPHAHGAARELVSRRPGAGQRELRSDGGRLEAELVRWRVGGGGGAGGARERGQGGELEGGRRDAGHLRAGQDRVGVGRRGRGRLRGRRREARTCAGCQDRGLASGRPCPGLRLLRRHAQSLGGGRRGVGLWPDSPGPCFDCLGCVVRQAGKATGVLQRRRHHPHLALQERPRFVG